MKSIIKKRLKNGAGVQAVASDIYPLQYREPNSENTNKRTLCDQTQNLHQTYEVLLNLLVAAVRDNHGTKLARVTYNSRTYKPRERGQHDAILSSTKIRLSMLDWPQHQSNKAIAKQIAHSYNQIEISKGKKR